MHWNFTGVPPVTDGSAGLDYIKHRSGPCRATERTMIALGIGVTPLGRLPHWSKLAVLFAEWSRRAQSRYDLERSVNVTWRT